LETVYDPLAAFSPASHPLAPDILERFPAKACPALDTGWIPVRVKKTRQNKKYSPVPIQSERKRLQAFNS
jgi:hypothetical protein